VGRYALSLPEGTVVDFERARWGLHEAERHHGRGAHGEALAEARVALEIAQRGFLAGEEAPWIQAHRRALADVHLHACECTVVSELRRGRPEIAEREAEDLLAFDPLREQGYRLLMMALAARGNPAEAGRVMADCRRVLREQAGLAPAPETERLFREITGSRT
jgi:DNA-binding SARP family transcriptional activator